MELETANHPQYIPMQRAEICENILDIAKEMYVNDVYCRQEWSNFRILSKDYSPRMQYFSFALDTDKLDDDQRITFRKRELAILKYDLDHIGFSLKGTKQYGRFINKSIEFYGS